MPLKHLGYIDLPAHAQPGGFDHAAVHRRSGRLYVAHTINAALDVIDCATDRYLYSIPNLTGVAGALASDERGLIFTSNRGENTIGIFAPDAETDLVKVPVGVRPNGLSFDPQRGLLLAANVGDPALAGSYTLSMVDMLRREMIASVPVPGRTRWAVFEPNDEPLWAQIRLNVGAFMQNLFRQGAFQGRTPREAYFVKCSSETTTQSDIDRGIVNIIVGFAPLQPAEFVIIKIQQIRDQAEA